MYCDKKISATMRERKRLSFNLELKALDQQGGFSGYASVFNIIDNQRDVILKGAFTKTLESRIADIKCLWQHQQDEPIGIFERMFEDEYGLYVEGKLLLDIRRAKEASTLLKAGVVKGLSIGYSPVHYRIDAQTGIRFLSEVDLLEVSLVTFPANESANVTAVKKFEPILSNREIEEWALAMQSGHVLELAHTLDDAIEILKN